MLQPALCIFNLISAVKGRIHEVDILLIHFFSGKLKSFSKTLEMDHLPLAQEADHIVDIRIIRQPQNIFIRDTGFLLCCHVLGQIGNNIALNRQRSSGEGKTAGRCWVDPGCPVNEICVKTCGFNLFLCQIPGQLVDNGADHFQMSKFFCTCMGVKKEPGANIITA